MGLTGYIYNTLISSLQKNVYWRLLIGFITTALVFSAQFPQPAFSLGTGLVFVILCLFVLNVQQAMKLNFYYI